MRESTLLSQFKTEVIDAGIESTLPYNLTDKWMDILTLEAEDFFSEDSESTGGIILLAVVHILVAKNRNRGGKLSFEEQELLNHMQTYQTELAIEKINRRTSEQFPKATLENIFTNRIIR